MTTPEASASHWLAWPDVWALVWLGCMAAAALVRLRYGVDFEDEALYAVWTQRVALGDQPFVDEANLRQGASVLWVPIYRLFVAAVGSNDGIILFFRHVFFAMQVGLAGAIYACARTLTARPYALLVASIAFAYVPLHIPAPGYNAVGALGLCAGVMLFLGAWRRPGTGVLGALAGAVMAFATFAYPPIVPIALLYGVVAVGVGARREAPMRNEMLGFVASSLLISAVLLALYLPDMWAGLPKALAYEADLTQPRGFSKLLALLRSVESISRPFGVLVFAAVAILLNRRPPLAAAGYAAAVLFAVAWFSDARDASAGFVLYAAMLPTHALVYVGLASLCVPRLLAPIGSRSVFWLGVLPSLSAGVIFGMASDHPGPVNIGFGTYAAALLGLMAFGASVQRSTGPWRPARYALPALVALTFTALGFSSVYKGASVRHQQAEVTTGPFAGLWTTEGKANVTNKTSMLLRSLEVGPEQRVVMLYDFPAGYLMANARPGLPVSWAQLGFDQMAMLPYYDDHRRGDGYILVLLDKKYSPELEAVLLDEGRLVSRGPWYRLYREPPLTEPTP